jgi:hypothetical protein
MAYWERRQNLLVFRETFERSNSKSDWQSFSQSVSQWVSESVSQSVSQRDIHSIISQPAIQPENQPESQSASQPTNGPATSQLVSQSVSHSAGQPASQSFSQSASEPASQPASQSASRPASQSVRQSVSQPASQPASQSLIPSRCRRLPKVQDCILVFVLNMAVRQPCEPLDDKGWRLSDISCLSNASDFRKSLAFWQHPRSFPFVPLVRITCGWRTTVGMIWMGGNRNTRTKTFVSATFSTTNLTLTELVSNPNLHVVSRGRSKN